MGARTPRRPFDSLCEKRGGRGNLHRRSPSHTYKGKEGDSASDSGLNRGHRLVG